MKFSPTLFDAHLRDTIRAFDVFCADHLLEGLCDVDHVCINCSSSATYDATREYFEKRAVFVYQSMVHGRRISIARLNDPFPTNMGFIHFVEIADQNEHRDQVDGIDHIEVVPKNLSYDQLISIIREKGIPLVGRKRADFFMYETDTTHLTIKFAPTSLIQKIKTQEMV